MAHRFPDEARAPLEAPTSGTQLSETCLPALIPAGTTRIRCHEAGMAARLAELGANSGPASAEVEIGTLSELSREAECAVLVLGASAEDSDRWNGRWRRLVNRLIIHIKLRLQVSTAVVRFRFRGYACVDVLMWDKRSQLRLPGSKRPRGALADRLPRRAVVRATRRRPPLTALEQGLKEAGRAAGRPLTPFVPLAKSGVIVVITERHVVRVAVGPGWRRIRRQADAVLELQSSGLSAEAKRLLPIELAARLTGLTRWSLETRVAGAPVPRGSIAAELGDDCLTFLVELFRSGARLAPAATLDETAEELAGVLGREVGQALRVVALRVSGRLAEVPRGVTHGDFFHGNLLVSDGRLSGVVDWDSAQANDLPLIDLLHLEASSGGVRGSLSWGPTITDRLLPEARAGGTPLARAYCARLGFTPDPALLESLVMAYWIRRLAYQVQGYADRIERPAWVERNVYGVLRAVRG